MIMFCMVLFNNLCVFQFDEGRNDLTSSIDESSIRAFIQENQLPLVIEFNAQVKENFID